MRLDASQFIAFNLSWFDPTNSIEAMVMDMNEKADHGKSVNYLSIYNFGLRSVLCIMFMSHLYLV